MSALNETAWQARLRYRLEDFRATALFGKGRPCSVKIRPHAGHFDRASAPRTYALIDERVRGGLSSRIWLGDHDSGPEILCALQSDEERLFLPAKFETLLREILMAAQTGRNAGDPLDDSLEVLIRGFDETGAYFEWLAMRADLLRPMTDEAIRAAFGHLGIALSPNPHVKPQRRAASIA